MICDKEIHRLRNLPVVYRHFVQSVKQDENIREPFVWDFGKQDALQTSWERPRFSTDSTVVPLSKQRADPHFLFNLEGALAGFSKIDFDFKGMARRKGDELTLPACATVIIK